MFLLDILGSIAPLYGRTVPRMDIATEPNRVYVTHALTRLEQLEGLIFLLAPEAIEAVTRAKLLLLKESAVWDQAFTVAEAQRRALADLKLKHLQTQVPTGALVRLSLRECRELIPPPLRCDYRTDQSHFASSTPRAYRVVGFNAGRHEVILAPGTQWVRSLSVRAGWVLKVFKKDIYVGVDAISNVLESDATTWTPITPYTPEVTE